MGKRKKKVFFNDIEKTIEPKEKEEKIIIENTKKEEQKENKKEEKEKIITRVYEDSIAKVM